MSAPRGRPQGRSPSRGEDVPQGQERSPGAVTEVAAAVLLRGDAGDARNEGTTGAGRTAAFAEYLLARRPPGKVYAGWWEFPGGKLETGESYRDALVRELHEELGITITQATPWLTREFVYPHATVRIRFFRVTAWNGEIHPHEHDAIAWLRCADACGQPPAVEPILPANGPILKGLALPNVCAITNAEENGVDGELARLERALAAGLGFVQVRDRTLPAAQRASFAQRAVALAHAHGALAVINGDSALAAASGADGVHLPAHQLMAAAAKPDFAWVGGSCHNAEELRQAARLGLDYALLGPLRATPTHPAAAGLGWPAFAALVEASPLPVFALGGMRPDMLATAAEHGAHGIALMRGWSA